MVNLLNIYGPASALLMLAALLAAGARAGYVTTAECKAHSKSWMRVRTDPVDSNATELYMDGCSLRAIPERLLTGLPAVTVLELSQNKLCQLPVFHEDTCHNLTVLLLHENQLTSINSGTLSGCIKLEVLSLTDNQIQFISHDVFAALTNLKFLHLQNNKIRFIPDQMFSNNGKLFMLHLHRNMITHLPPDFASKLKRAAPSLNRFTFFDNPWHCACLIELLADVRHAGVHHIKDIYGGGAYDGAAPVCVYIDTPRYKCREIRELSALLFNK